MDDQRLRYFLAVVNEGSIGAAAEALGVPQSSLSQAIRALERELDAPLFTASGTARASQRQARLSCTLRGRSFGRATTPALRSAPSPIDRFREHHCRGIDASANGATEPRERLGCGRWRVLANPIRLRRFPSPAASGKPPCRQGFSSGTRPACAEIPAARL